METTSDSESMDIEGHIMQPPPKQMVEGWIPHEHMASFSEYKYKSPYKTFLEGVVLDWIWERMMFWMPKCIAPNLITISGLIIMILSIISILISDITLVKSWEYIKYYIVAFAIWVYQTLDSLDGKQARRTGTSSVLGELFDHGCDAVATVCLGILFGIIFQTGPSTATCILFLSQIGTFTMFTFEKRFTYVLRTAIWQFGTIEAHYVYIVVCILKAKYGEDMQHFEISWLSNLLGVDWTFKNIMVFIMGIIIFQGIFMTLKTAYKAAKEAGESHHCMMYFGSIMMNYACFLLFFPMMTSYKSLTVMWLLLVSFSMVKLCWKFIICSVLKFHFNPFSWDQVLPAATVIVWWLLELMFRLSPNKATVTILWCGLIVISFFVSLVHALGWAYGTIYQIADHLSINVFTIKQKPKFNGVNNKSSHN